MAALRRRLTRIEDDPELLAEQERVRQRGPVVPESGGLLTPSNLAAKADVADAPGLAAWQASKVAPAGLPPNLQGEWWMYDPRVKRQMAGMEGVPGVPAATASAFATQVAGAGQTNVGGRSALDPAAFAANQARIQADQDRRRGFEQPMPTPEGVIPWEPGTMQRIEDETSRSRAIQASGMGGLMQTGEPGRVETRSVGIMPQRIRETSGRASALTTQADQVDKIAEQHLNAGDMKSFKEYHNMASGLRKEAELETVRGRSLAATGREPTPEAAGPPPPEPAAQPNRMETIQADAAQFMLDTAKRNQMILESGPGQRQAMSQYLREQSAQITDPALKQEYEKAIAELGLGRQVTTLNPGILNAILYILSAGLAGTTTRRIPPDGTQAAQTPSALPAQAPAAAAPAAPPGVQGRTLEELLSARATLDAEIQRKQQGGT